MKQALVLGFALAANAMTADQVDNELIVAPSGGKFGDLGKFTTKMSKVMFDEQADDELLIRPLVQADDDEFMVRLLPRESFASEEEYQKYVARMRFHRDDAADDELVIKWHTAHDGRITAYDHRVDPVSKMLYVTKVDDDELFVAPQGKLADLAKKYPGMIMFDEQADDAELFVAPTGKLAEFAKKHPGIMFDEQADDELLIRPIVNADDDEFMVRLLPRESFASEEEYQKYVARMRFHRDDELLIKFNRFNKEKRQEVLADDDELFVAPQGKLADLAKKYPGMIMFDEQADDELHMRPLGAAVTADDDEFRVRPLAAADDELLAMIRTDADGVTRAYHPYYDQATKKFKILNDDEELFVAPQGKLADLAKKYPGMIMFDEQADDELVAIKKKPFEESKHAIFLRGQREREAKLNAKKKLEESKMTEKYSESILSKNSQADDDELFVMDHSVPEQYKHLAPKNLHIYRSEEADDELLIRPLVKADDDEFIAMLLPREHFKTEEEYQKYVARMRFSRDDAADDELAFVPKAPRVFGDKDLLKSVKLSTSQALVRGDDEADDELIYLGNLMKYLENEKIAAAAHTFDDDELRAEKPSHVKAPEIKQMKSELPKMKRKLRPADETPFLA